MSKLTFYMDAFKREFKNLIGFSSTIGNQLNSYKQAGADYLFARMNYMMTKMALAGAINPEEFLKDAEMELFFVDEKREAIIKHPINVAVDSEIEFLSNARVQNDKQMTQRLRTVASKLEEFDEKVLSKCKTEEDYKQAEKAHKAILGKLPPFVVYQMNEHVEEDKQRFFADLHAENFDYGKNLKTIIEHLLDVEGAGNDSPFENYWELKANLHEVFADPTNIDYSKLQQFDHLKGKDGREYNFFSAAKLSSRITQFANEAMVSGDYSNFHSVVDAFEKHMNIASKNLTDKQMFRFAALSTSDNIISQYMAQPQFTHTYIDGSDIGVAVSHFNFANETARQARDYLNGMRFNCSDSVRLEHRLAFATMDFNALDGKDVDKQIGIIKALEIKHSQRNIFWRFFNYLRSGKEIETIVEMKKNLIERGVDKRYLATMLNEDSDEKKLYRVPSTVGPEKELWQKPVSCEYIFDALDDYTKNGQNPFVDNLLHRKKEENENTLEVKDAEEEEKKEEIIIQDHAPVKEEDNIINTNTNHGMSEKDHVDISDDEIDNINNDNGIDKMKEADKLESVLDNDLDTINDNFDLNFFMNIESDDNNIEFDKNEFDNFTVDKNKNLDLEEDLEALNKK